MVDKIARQLKIEKFSVQNVIRLLDEECTIPFIARYRKEQTGNLDEVQIQYIKDSYVQFVELEKRRKSILLSLTESRILTDQLETSINKASSLVELEDLYLPYRPKRKTRGSLALEKGLLPLAEKLMNNIHIANSDLEKYINIDLELENIEDVLHGAQDILAEILNEKIEIREPLRLRLRKNGVLQIRKSRSAPENHSYQAFIDKEELISSMPSHRLLAVLRGVNEGFLSIKLQINELDFMQVYLQYLKLSLSSLQMSLKEVILDSWKRLTQPSLENEILSWAKSIADHKAVYIFAENLKNLLLASPLGQKPIIAIDPGIRTGCKLVVLSAQGDLLDHTVIYPIPPFNKIKEAEMLIITAIDKYKIEAIAVGNGTGGRETFDFLNSLSLNIPVISVNENGASIYSASEIARDEFPDQDITVRGAVSIGRRLLDPLAELVKIDPKSIGVGQYQHDVDQKLLKSKLEDVVAICVNKVGVEINTASKSILSYVSGLNIKLAASIIDYRKKNGPFRSRLDILKVKGIGPKVYQQSAGFLRIRNADNPLDSTAVHPESYPIVDKIAKKMNCPISELIGKIDLRNSIEEIDIQNWNVGKETLVDIFSELQRPGRDPRPNLAVDSFDQNIRNIADLKEGQILDGLVTNVTAFGAFIDIGIHQDGLVHISQMSDRFVQDPLAVVHVGQSVRVKVLNIDKERKRIGLTMKDII